MFLKVSDRKGLALLLAAAFGFLTTTPVWAQVRFGDIPNVATGFEPPRLNMLEGVFADTLGAVFALAGIGAFVYLVIGGFRYITAGGDPKALADAQKAISYALIGLAVTAFLYFILKVLSEIFYGPGGLNLLEFTIPAPSP